MNTEPSWTQRWQPQLNWNTPAGQLLDRLVAALPSDRAWRIVVFGSAPLQLAYDPAFISADVDLIVPEGEIESYCAQASLLKGMSELYIDVCSIAAFEASPDWTFRACESVRSHVTFIFPHPIDLLVPKMKRLEEKDLRAFNLVRSLTGHPTENELIEALQRMVDMFKPSFDEEKGTNPAANVKLLWKELFNREINIPVEIIQPAVAARKAEYNQGSTAARTILSHL
jgi:hypothetical protein